MPRYSSRIGYVTRAGVPKKALIRVTAPDISTASSMAADAVRADSRRQCAEVRVVDTVLERDQS